MQLSLLKTHDERLLASIILAVLLLHVLFMGWLAFQTSHTPQINTSRRVVVKTIALQPKKEHARPSSPTPIPAETPAAVVAEVAPQVSTAKQVSKPTPKPKPVVKAAKKEPPKPAPKPKSEERARPSQETISKIQENLSKISTTKLQKPSAVEIPTNLTALAIDNLPDIAETGSSAEMHYRDDLARHLRVYLILPERGEVVIKLSLGRAGNVIKLTVVSAASKANKAYVEKTVPGLSFAPFGIYFGGENQHTFTIALRSEAP